MGSHWDPFFENGANDIIFRLKEMLRAGTPTKGFGGTNTAPHFLPHNWQVGVHLVWPRADRGAIMSIATDPDQNSFCTVYPFWAEGGICRLQLKDVLIWESGVEGQITALFGAADITFFDTLYLHSRCWYERGREYPFSLAGIAYGARPAEDVEIPFKPNPDQIAWEAELARVRGEELPEEPPKTISLKGGAFFMNIDEWDRDDYSFRGPVKQVTPFSDFLGRDGWVVRTTVLRQSDADPKDFDLDIVITTLAWEGEAPPEVGQDVEGSLWLQGYLKGE